MGRADFSAKPLWVAMLDIDKFKNYNDEHGHLEGDRLLRETASAWREQLRDGDTLARYGGEEFCVALPDGSADQALAVVERLRAKTQGGCTVSAGLSRWDQKETAEELVARVDKLLYEAKHTGRDRIAWSDAPIQIETFRAERSSAAGN